MNSTRAIAIGGLLTITAAAALSGGFEAMLWVGGFSCLSYAFVSALIDF